MEEPKLVSELEKYRSKEPWPDTPPGPLPEEICECDGLEPPCHNCGYCTACDTRIKGNLYDRHAWRHYYGSQEWQDVQDIKQRTREAASRPTVVETKREPVAAQGLFDMLDDLE